MPPFERACVCVCVWRSAAASSVERIADRLCVRARIVWVMAWVIAAVMATQVSASFQDVRAASIAYYGVYNCEGPGAVSSA